MEMKFHMPKEVEKYSNNEAYMAGFKNALVIAQIQGFLNIDIRDLKIQEYLSKEDIQRCSHIA